MASACAPRNAIGPALQRRIARSAAARVLLLADGDEAAVALDQPAVAGRIRRLEAERDEIRRRRPAPGAGAAALGAVISGVSA